MKINVKVPQDLIDKDIQAKLQALAFAQTNAIRDVARVARDKGKQAISAAGFSDTFADTLHMKFFPKKGVATKPAAYIHTTANFADVFETGAIITPVAARYIWLPLPAAPQRPGSGRLHMSPQQYIKDVGPLVFMRRPGKPPMLGAKIKRRSVAQPFGKFATRTQLKHGTKNTIGIVEVIPLYVGVQSVNIPKKFNVTAAMTEAANGFEDAFNHHFVLKDK